MSRLNAGIEFEQFVNDSVDELWRTAHLIVWDETEAEDLVQECLFKVARRWPRVRRMKHPRAYARRVLVNLALDGRARRTQHHQELDGAEQVDVIDDSSMGEPSSIAVRDELLGALASLPPRQRAVLVLRYFADLRESEVAEILGCPIGTVKSSASRALERLERTLRPIPTN